MSFHQQPLFDEPAGASPAPDACDAPIAVGSIAPAAPARPAADARAATHLRLLPEVPPAPARRPRELWAAVQSDDWPALFEAVLPGSLPAPLAALVKRAQGFSPRVTLESSDALLLELAGSLRLFGGLHALLAALREAFPRPLRLALAPTPLAAVLLARAGANCCILDAARLAGRLAPLPLTHLRWPEEDLARLAGMGVRTLAELQRLPRAGLARRIGPERLWQLDRLTGARPDPRTPLAQPERFRERIDPDYETRDCERLQGALQPVLERLELFLRERQRGITALALRLHHRHAEPVTCVLRCVAPEYRAARFAALLAARLERVVLAEPVRRMQVLAGSPRRFLAATAPLWAAGEQGGASTASQAPEFLQALLARLGEEAVYGLAEIDEHRPERQQQRVGPWLASAFAAGPRRGEHRAALRAQAHFGVAPAGVARPLGLFDAPRPLEVRRDADGHVRALRHEGQPLTLISGPERIQTGWWDGGQVARDYYVAGTADGARWWIFRECEAPRRWFVHGCFA
jgi:protein ImuB